MFRALRFPRLVRVLLAALQLSLSGAAVVADGMQEAEAARARVHVESHSSPSCPAPHADDCVICRFLQSPAAASGGVVDPLPPPCEGSWSAWSVREHLSSWTPSSPLARGPPALS
jgi:hypothetical protein